MNNKITITQIQGLDAETILGHFKNIGDQLTSLQDKVNPEEDMVLLTRKEVAKFLSVSLVTLHRWNKNGILKSYRLGNEVRYKKHDIYQLLQFQDSITEDVKE